MTKILLATTMLAGLLTAGIAQAADMPLKAPPRAAPYYNDWNGFYVFGFGGYSWGKINTEDFDLSVVNLHNPKPKGGVFGFGAGYNWQYGAWVGGLEVDYGFSDQKENQTVNDSGGSGSCIAMGSGLSCGSHLSLNSKIDALGSARARVGYLFTPNLLTYGTAGLAWGRAKVNISYPQEDCDSDFCTFSSKTNLFGWVAGGGMEYKLFDHVRVRGEYLHYDFGSTSFAFQPFITINNKVTDDVARGALIWSFN